MTPEHMEIFSSSWDVLFFLVFCHGFHANVQGYDFDWRNYVHEALKANSERLNSLELFSLQKEMTEAYDKADKHKVVWSKHIGINSFFLYLEGRKNEGTSQVQTRHKEMALHTGIWEHKELLGKDNIDERILKSCQIGS